MTNTEQDTFIQKDNEKDRKSYQLVGEKCSHDFCKKYLVSSYIDSDGSVCHVQPLDRISLLVILINDGEREPQIILCDSNKNKNPQFSFTVKRDCYYEECNNILERAYKINPNCDGKLGEFGKFRPQNEKKSPIDLIYVRIIDYNNLNEETAAEIKVKSMIPFYSAAFHENKLLGHIINDIVHYQDREENATPIPGCDLCKHNLCKQMRQYLIHNRTIIFTIYNETDSRRVFDLAHHESDKLQAKSLVSADQYCYVSLVEKFFKRICTTPLHKDVVLKAFKNPNSEIRKFNIISGNMEHMSMFVFVFNDTLISQFDGYTYIPADSAAKRDEFHPYYELALGYLDRYF